MGHLEDVGSGRSPASAHLRLTLTSAFRPSIRWITAGTVVLLLALWEWLAQRGLVTTLFFPSPSEFTASFIDMVTSGDLAMHLGATLRRVLFGLVLGGSPALLVGLMMGWAQTLREALDPVVAALHPLPKIAILPLVIIFLGIGERSTVAVIAFSAFFPMLISAMASVQQINPVHFEVAQQYGAGRIRILTDVVVPAALPILVAGLRLTLNTVLVVTIAVELVVGRAGLGRMIWASWQLLQVDRLYASLAVIAVLGIVFNQGLGWLSKLLIPWNRT